MVAKLQASTREVKQEMEAIEKWQRVSDEQEMERQWRREDREQAERL